ncbi:Na(+)/H(+) antiporter subunit B [Nitrosomonas halophila]|uniref:Uncharacterized MnhB-related membrane protein n=1 Tax=Nitrosomonas halophila TaxID=44576 RepID=A0A1H3HAH7_9PROT|nr:DUF4040 domain-containing protein [Nitrosomonas halophila]SDY12360.1 Uncharacterized MnhB-related membrane protein [Nitrosomonas halophila]HRQ04427.1 DUF4040 domain-containing protein [Nitrosomonas halophila]
METLTALTLAFDVLLALLLLLTAGFALFGRNLFRAIVLYIAFGLLLALVWIRLDAPDIALAEIAIGAGLTGALLLSAWARLERSDDNQAADESSQSGQDQTRTPH